MRPDRIKTCYVCKLEKKITEFYTNGKTAAGYPKYMSRCKLCDSKRVPSTTREESHKKWRQKVKTERREWLLEIKKKLSCVRCGMSFKDTPWLVDFHHRDPSQKLFQVGCAPTFLKPKSVIQTELDKCDPICANCHRTLHYEERKNNI